MGQSAAEALDTYRALPAEARRTLVADMIRDVVARDGQEEAIRLLIANVFDSRTPLMELQLETLAAFARLPRDVAAAVLARDPAAIRVEDCISDDEVERMLAEAGD